MNEIKIKKFMKQLLFLNGVKDTDINYSFDESDKKYKIYHNLNERLMEDIDFAIKFDELLDTVFNSKEIHSLEFIGNKFKLEKLNKEKNFQFFESIRKNNSILNTVYKNEISEKTKVKTAEINNSFYSEYGVAS